MRGSLRAAYQLHWILAYLWLTIGTEQPRITAKCDQTEGKGREGKGREGKGREGKGKL